MAKKPRPDPLGDDDAPPAADRTVSQSDNLDSATTTVAADQLQALIDRIERMETEKKSIADDIKEIYGEAKANGFDTKIMRKVIARRKRDKEEVQEEESILHLYLNALGMA